MEKLTESWAKKTYVRWGGWEAMRAEGLQLAWISAPGQQSRGKRVEYTSCELGMK